MENNILAAMLIFSFGTINIPLALNKSSVSWFNWTAFGFCCGISVALLTLQG